MSPFEQQLANIAKIAVGIFAAFLLALLFLIAGGMTARAHEATNTAGEPLGWQYPISCCSLTDCRPAKHDEVRETSEGYRLTSTGEVVGYLDKRVKQSPSGDFHVCQQGGDFDHGRVLCLFAPGRNF